MRFDVSEGRDQVGCHCPVGRDWPEYKLKIDTMVTHASEVHKAMNTMHEDVKHLKTISETLVEIKTGLLEAVLGKDIVPMKITTTLLDSQAESYRRIIKLLCWAFGSILVVIIGLKYAAPHLVG